jgi:Fe-S-cluster containining protein
MVLAAQGVDAPAQVVTSCEGCGVCCTEVPVPPFLDDIDFIPAELQREVIEAQKVEAELTAQRRPCIWHDPKTMKCIHHDHRPNICREFEIGGELCLEIRERFRITTPRA